jgi:acyl-CoA thioesterase-1
MNDRRTFIQSSLIRSLMLLGGGVLASSWKTLPDQISAGDPAADLARIKAILETKTPIKWVFVGDSITHGAKHTFGARSYPEIFGERIRWELRRVRDVIINTAISGNTATDILADYEWRIRQFSPAVVFIMVGTNDANEKRAISTDLFQTQLQEMVRLIRRENAVPVLQTPNTVLIEKATGRERIAEYVEAIRRAAAAEGTILVDHWQHWAAQGKSNILELHKWLNDELHPNGRGHDEMAKTLFRALGIYDPASFTGKDHVIDHM